jgi:broad specificity phosphatase PhoE
MPTPKFIFVRHGEAEHNVAFHKEGDAAFTNPAYKDAPLTEEGRKQARATGEALRDLPILDIWSSPLTRAIQTGEEIYEEVNAQEVWLHDSLLERQGGGHVCNERKYKMDLRKAFPMWRREFLPEMQPMWFDAENDTSLQRRMLSFILLLAHIYRDVPADSHVVIVSHANALGALLHRSFKNAEYVIMSLEEVLAVGQPAPAVTEV